MGAARVKKKARRNVDKSRGKSRKVDAASEIPNPAIAAPETVERAPVPQPHGGALIPGKGRGPAPGAPNAGRPRNAVRRTFRDILKTEGAVAAREVLLGEPDKQGRVPEHHERRNWLRELAEIGFNERLRTAQLRAEAAANTGAKAQAGVQLILQGGPAGNLRPDSGT